MISQKINPIQGIEGARRATEIPWMETARGTGSMQSMPANLPDPEVSEKPVRHHFTAECKLNILRQAEGCREPGNIGALLRREGLYSSHLTTWRRQRDAALLSALKPKRRGRKAVPPNPLQAENEQLRKENNRLQKRLKQAELIIEVQKKFIDAGDCPGGPRERRGRLMEAVEILTPEVGHPASVCGHWNRPIQYLPSSGEKEWVSARASKTSIPAPRSERKGTSRGPGDVSSTHNVLAIKPLRRSMRPFWMKVNTFLLHPDHVSAPRGSQ